MKVRLAAYRFRYLAVGLAFVLLAGACTGDSAEGGGTAGGDGGGPISAEEVAIIDGAVADVSSKLREPLEEFTFHRVLRVGEIEDRRLAWVVSDLMQFVFRGEPHETLVDTAERLGGLDLPTVDQRKPFTDALIDEELAAPPGYVEWKEELYTSLEPAWQPFFDDAGADVDWRMISFGGVPADKRPFGDGGPCQCIPALDLPPIASAAEAEAADVVSADEVVFGVVHNGEARAYPRYMMELHELANDELGGEPVSLVYCTLCGSAQGFRSEGLVLRTSGLLLRSNKVMFDLTTGTAYDTFAGLGIAGPRRGERIDQVSVVTSGWSDWLAAHPDTTVMMGDPAIDYPFDPLGDRDAGGPIFPIGAVDDRGPAQTQILGAVTPDGTAIAFDTRAARVALGDGGVVELGGVVLELDGGGLRATFEGEPIVSHQAFWFAWSQRHPDTLWWS